MLKRALRVLSLLLLAVPAPAFAVGTIAYSLSQNLDASGKPLSGCQFYTYQAGTTATPQNAYKDTALTLPQPNPMTCDASGRLPQFFLADGQIKIRLDDKFGVNQVTADNILVIGPSSGGGGGGSVDPTTIAATGDVKAAYGTGTIVGWVRANGRTIGSSTSGATERANADTQALFQYLWSADPNLIVSSGRGASSAADWAANKTIALPDFRGRTIAGLDDMGNAAAGRLTATYFGSSGGCSSAAATTLGVGCGGESASFTLLNSNLPPYTPSGSIGVTGSVTAAFLGASGSGQTSGNPTTGAPLTNIPISVSISGATFTGTPQGGTSTPVVTKSIQPTILTTIYVKL